MTIEQVRNTTDRSLQEQINLLTERLTTVECRCEEVLLERRRRNAAYQRKFKAKKRAEKAGKLTGNITGNITSGTVLAKEELTKSNIVTLSKNKESKKERTIAKTSLLPDDWTPSPTHYRLAEKLGLSQPEVGEAAEEMRAWSLGNGMRRTNWDWVFNNWMRRNAKKGRSTNGRPQTKKERLGTMLQSLGSGEFWANVTGNVPQRDGNGRAGLPSGDHRNIHHLPVRDRKESRPALGYTGRTPDLFTNGTGSEPILGKTSGNSSEGTVKVTPITFATDDTYADD